MEGEKKRGVATIILIQSPTNNPITRCGIPSQKQNIYPQKPFIKGIIEGTKLGGGR